MLEERKHVLVTGGAGYIGSHAAKALSKRGYIPVTYDNLVNGHRWAVQWGPLVEGDIGDKAKLVEVIRRFKPVAVIHFAASAYVAESMRLPAIYFNNNVAKSLTLLDAIADTGVRHVVFSSSCATYGVPAQLPVTEDSMQLPVNPYGETKLVIERALRWYGSAYGISWVALRYFNAAGADPDGELGEVHLPETHLIPLVIQSAQERGVMQVFGDDYATVDGTCVRDFVHVSDLADAHVRALDYTLRGGASIAINLGTGEGKTVGQVIRTVERVTARPVATQMAARRPGDPAVLVADPSLARQVLQWEPAHSGLENIVRSAWNWHTKQRGKPPKVRHSSDLTEWVREAPVQWSGFKPE